MSHNILAPHLSVLLPPARVAFHVLDTNILSAVEQLKTDWRFARIQFDGIQGDVTSAVQAYQNKPSPDLLLIETKTIDDALTASLETLASVCSENTSAIVIGPVNDVYLYRKLIDMGVSDYLVGPLSKDQLADVIAKALVTKLGQISSRLIAFVGAKGGIGTSTLSQYASLISSETFAQKTLLLDAAGAWSYMPLAMGGEQSATMAEVYRLMNGTDKDAFRRLFHNVNDKLSILPTGLEKLLDDTISADQFESLINHLMVVYPVVIVDLSGSSNTIKKLVLNRSHEIIILSNPTVSSLRTARTLMNEIKDLHDHHDENVDLIVNMTDMSKESEVSKADIEKVIDKKPFGYISFQPKAFLNAEILGKRDLNNSPMSDMIDLLTKLLHHSIGNNQALPDTLVKEEKSGFMSGFLSSLKTKK
jgi:pilus assembly protein CpaE